MRSDIRSPGISVELLVELASRFYLGGQTQAEIARDLGLDPSTISRHLKRARDEGIVRIEIRRPQGLHADLGRELADRFRLRRAVVVADSDGTNATVAGAAAEYLGTLLTNGTRLALSFGRMPSDVVHALPAGTVSGLEISLLLGGFGVARAGIQGHELARHVASLYPRSRVHYLHAPLMVDSPDIKQAMLRDGSIRAALAAAANSELALVGIGSLSDDAPLVRYGDLSVDDRNRLLRAGAVGDICARFFRADGQPVMDLDDRMMAIERAELAAIPTVVAVAAGPEKYAAIRGALRTGYMDVLVTDEMTAQHILRDKVGLSRRAV
jgi:DNA-binding transcriptional regulator LsrR (DeoR family)